MNQPLSGGNPQPTDRIADDRFVARTRVAYFSMEIAIWPEMPTYSGGLGILAGDTARAASDLELPIVFVTLVSRAGYLRQELDAAGHQGDVPDPWDPQRWARPLPAMVAVPIEERAVWVRPWLHVLQCPTGGAVPILLLDTDVSENDPADRGITSRLYGGDASLRLKQEIVLGIGGERLLRALGFEITTYHLNEGHAALLALALLRRYPQATASPEGAFPYDLQPVRERCVFTTHTPVEAGHDRFDYELVRQLLGDFVDIAVLRSLGGEDALNMTRLALNLSGYINGVAERHQETAARMFPGYPIRAITNGVHPASWTHPAFARLFGTLGAHWPHEPELLGRADLLADEDVRTAHAEAKAELLATIRAAGGPAFDPASPILAFARRMTGYKRPHLLFDDPERLAAIARHQPFQVVFAGKAHPRDEGGKELIARLYVEIQRLRGAVPMAFLPGYDIALARKLVSGADVWLNTPQPPLEASGTSGMKAALNGVPSLSVLDGWWVEGCIEGVTGWAIGAEGDAPETHGAALLDKLEGTVLPLFHRDSSGWARVMKGAISKVGAVFTSHRMMRRYAAEAYLSSGR
jgi:glycogen phosphorylase